MREARILIELGDVKIDETLQYNARDEEKLLMRLAHSRIKAELKKRKKKVALVFLPPPGVRLMQVIVAEMNEQFKRSDLIPESWPEFRVWVIKRGFLQIKELTEDDRPSANP